MGTLDRRIGARFESPDVSIHPLAGAYFSPSESIARSSARVKALIPQRAFLTSPVLPHRGIHSVDFFSCSQRESDVSVAPTPIASDIV